MLLATKFITILGMVSLCFCAPATTSLEDRSISKRWAITGIILSNEIRQEFGISGVNLAQAVRANLVDQWNKAYGGSGIISSLGYYNALTTENLYYTSIQSLIFFSSQYNTQIFVTVMQSYLKSKGTNDKTAIIDDGYYTNVTVERRTGIDEIEEKLG